MGVLRSFYSRLSRKRINDPLADDTELNRVLSTLDLTALGIGSTLGLGVYVLAGEVAKQTAGPSVTISFLIAGIASAFAGLCYAEFGARVPKAGSAYVYSYVTVGELIAFIIGWNLILEYIIGTASVAKGYSGYLDALLDHKMSGAFRDVWDIHKDVSPALAEYIAEYFDFFAFGVTFFTSVILAVGVNISSMFNKLFTLLNLAVILFGPLKVFGCFVLSPHCITIFVSHVSLLPAATPENWNIPEDKTTLGSGGFLPYGISGMLAGAATCFYGFVGFDVIATTGKLGLTGEETRNPQKSIPFAIVLSLSFIFLAYFGISTVLTMMVPYYSLNENSPIPSAFADLNWNFAKWIVSIGALFGLSTSLLGGMFPLPRVVYAMAMDGVMFRCLSSVNSWSKTPLLATLLAGLFGGIMAALFELRALVDMMSIGTLLAYTLVAACVLILRFPKILPTLKFTKAATLVGFNTLLVQAETEIFTEHETWALTLLGIFGFFILVHLIILFRQPQQTKGLKFKVISPLVIFSFLYYFCQVPFIPLLPALSIFINTYLMLKLSVKTWERFGVWMAIGEFLHFSQSP
ncbi:unnamed protein product, partial [Darwinula stevensoni]